MKFHPIHLIVILIICFISTSNVIGGEIKYKIEDIPKNLLKDAKAVVRSEEIIVDVRSNNKVVEKVKYAISILNKNGKRNGYFMHMYDKNIKVSNIKAKMYDKSGNEIKKKGGFEILDYALISSGTIYDDSRIKAIDPEHFEYPYTIEYTYEVTLTEVINYPEWSPIRDYNVAVEKSTFTLVVDKRTTCRYFEKNLKPKASIEESSENNIYSWQLENHPAYTEEDFSPALDDFAPSVILAPAKVKVEEYEGNFETWEGFGEWINQLNKGKNNLNNETKAKIRKITEGIADDKSKIKILYEYMQNKTRYVGIQVGIGGYQPFDAETVDRLSYGDCKALSNYMKSLLEVVGIDSRYTLVQAGRENPTINSIFVHNQFNHVILCVPTVKDTVWLECTSQRIPYNYLGTFTADRKALIVDGNGGKLVQTPRLTASANLESRKITVNLDESGGGFADCATTYSGATYDRYMPILMSDQTDRKDMIIKKIHVPNFDLDHFDISETKSEIPFVTEKLKLTLNNYTTKVGERMLLCLNIMNKQSLIFQSSTRKTTISIKWPAYEIDTVLYNFPKGFTLEKIPSKVNFQSDFGSYSTEVTKTDSGIQYVRTFIVYKGEYPIEKYEEIETFFNKIVTADENKVMLTRGM